MYISFFEAVVPLNLFLKLGVRLGELLYEYVEVKQLTENVFRLHLDCIADPFQRGANLPWCSD